MTLVYTMNYLDRGLVTLLLQPIKQDLQLSDTQLGFLTGIAFALFYATLGLPIARWADRGNRVTITSIAIAVWGMTVMASVLVTNFYQLVLARVAAGVGEAGCMPPTYSLLGDYFPGAAERTRAMTIYWLANPLAALASYFLGGWLNHLYGWRMTFFIFGLPALILAPWFKLGVVEPRATDKGRPTTIVQPPLRMARVLKILWAQRSTRHLVLCILLLWVQSAGLAQWEAAFLMRSHGLSTEAVGVRLGFIYAGSGLVGIATGGYVTSRWFASDVRAQLRLSAIMIAAMVPCYACFLLLSNNTLALVALIPSLIVCNFFIGPTFALLQRLVANDMRATALALTMLLANLIGMGIGPQAVGIISDALSHAAGQDSLRYAMLIVLFVALWSAAHCWIAGQNVEQDLKAHRSDESSMRSAPDIHGFRA